MCSNSDVTRLPWNVPHTHVQVKAMAERDARNEELKRKLEARDSDLRMMEELLEQKNRLVRDLELEKADPLSKDIAAFFGGDEAPATGAAPATASASAGKDEQRESDPETPAATVVAGSPGLGNDIDMYFKQGTSATTTTATAATPAAASPPAPPTTATVRPHPRL